jgi:ubiquinone/menaquinone biosynthesis C-methylase UbiE
VTRQTEIKRYYEEFYAQAPKARKAPDYRRICSNLRHYPYKTGDRIIDIGCGTGGTLSYLLSKGANPLGLDISLQALKDVGELFPKIGTVLANAENLPFRSKSMDGILFMGTLEHFLKPDKALSEALRLSKRGARLCIVVPNSRFFLFRWLGGTEQEQETPRTLEEWEDMFREQDLVVERVYRDVGPSITTGKWMRSVPRRLILAGTSLLPLRYAYQFVFICRTD